MLNGTLISELIGVMLPESEVLGRVHRNNMMTGTIGLASFIIALLLSLLVSSRFSRPLRKLASEAEAIGRFQLEAGSPRGSIVKEVVSTVESAEST